MSCNTYGYTGQNFCDRNSRFGKPTGIIFAKDSHTLSAANFLLEASWITGVQSELVYPLHYMENFEDMSSESNYYEYASGRRKHVDQGKYRFAAFFDVNECTKKQLVNFRGFEEGIYLVYGDVIRGRTTDSGVNIAPIRVSNINVEKASLPLMDNTPEMVKIIVDIEDDKDLNEYDYSREMSWDVKDVDGLTQVSLALVGTASATSVVVDVTSSCGGNTKAISGLGADTTSWAISSKTTFTGVTESSTVPGRYTLAGTGIATGTVTLNGPSVRTDDVLVIADAALSITVS
jgi:hypothetical protein